MALRSVVLETPAPAAAPRRTVVLRAGGPAPKGKAIDLVALVVGVLLLMACIALAQVLPDKTYLNPQFRLSFIDQGGEFGSQGADFLEGTAELVDFTYEIPVDNVYAITMQIFFEDDLLYSHPDIFRVELIDPSGNLVGTHQDFTSPRPRANGTMMVSDPPDYTPVTITVVEHPSEQIITGLAHTETPEQALAREEPKYRQATTGTWTLRVRLQEAGDCPDPNDTESGTQGFYCRFGDPNNPAFDPTAMTGRAGGQDPGNAFTIENVQYSWYTPVIEELK